MFEVVEDHGDRTVVSYGDAKLEFVAWWGVRLSLVLMLGELGLAEFG